MKEFLKKYKVIITLAVGLVLSGLTAKGYVDQQNAKVIQMVINAGIDAGANAEGE